MVKFIVAETQEHFSIYRFPYHLTGLYTGKGRCAPGHFWEGMRGHFLFHHIISGRGTFWKGDFHQELGAGDAFVIFPRTRVRYEASKTDPWSYQWVGFTGIGLEDVLGEAGILSSHPIVKNLGRPLLSRLFEDLMKTVKDRTPGCEIRADGILHSLVGALIEWAPQSDKPDKRGEEYVERVVDFIHQHYGKEISIAQLAAAVGLDRSYLTGLFRKKTGKSLNRYLIHFRMEKARELLRRGKMSVQEVCFSVGYDNIYAFSKRFKRETGLSPRDFILR